jgi:ribonuclease BN (tRNA processing enzyme)
VEFTVLGKSPAMPDAGGAQSGYLVTHAGFTLLLDCGSGVFAKLRAYADPAAVDAVVISHLHADHMLDLLPFSFALANGLLANGLLGERQHKPQLWAPPGATAAFSAYTRAVGMEDQINDGFAVGEYATDAELELGPFAVSFCAVPHYIPAWGCDVRSADGPRITFGGDCGPNDAIVELARDTDLLILEATEGAGPHSGDGPRGHLTAAEAGELARRAGARRLLLTHYSDQLDAEALRAAAMTAFGGSVELAAEAARYAI